MTFLDIYKEYATEITDAPIEFHDYVGIATIGSTIGNKCFFPFGDSTIYPNFWLILTAPSSIYRKSTSLNIGRRLLYDFDATKVYPSEFSHERIIANISQQPAGTFYFSEFLTLLGLLSRDYMSPTKGFLTDVYDSFHEYRREISKVEYVIRNPAVSIHAATTLDWFIHRLKEDDIAGGFVTRFLIVPCKQKTQDLPIPPMADPEKRKKLLSIMHAISTLSGGFYLSEEAKQLHKEWYIRTSNVEIGKYSSFIQRLQIYILKFAMCLEVNNSMSLKISGKSMKEAIAYVNYIVTSLKDIVENELAFTKEMRSVNKIKKILQEHKEIKRSDLLRLSHLPVRDFNNAIETLMQSDLIKQEYRKEKGQKRSLFYILETTV